MTEIINTQPDGDMTLTIRVTYEEWNAAYAPHGVYVTHNGYQWTGLTLRSEEAVVALRDTLNEYIWERGIE